MGPQAVPGDLLVEVAALHTENLSCPAHIVMMFLEFGLQEYGFSLGLEFLEVVQIQEIPRKWIGLFAGVQWREICRQDHRARAENQQPLDEIAELTDVSGPIVPPQDFDGLVGKGASREFSLLGKFLDEMGEQQHHVIATVP